MIDYYSATSMIMIVLFSLTICVTILYLLYPVWLILIASNNSLIENETEAIDHVSVILLSYNGQKYLKDKIDFLLKELSGFNQSELIIIDDDSTDGSQHVLNDFEENTRVTIIRNTEHSGIAYSMNLGVSHAKYQYLVFCDQRQELSMNILKRIVEPLKNKNVGAVSGCISPFDKEQKNSYIRRHENFLKQKESKAGNLMGVYGPFYAIKKHCYCQIPNNIVLDDLYLSLKILKSKQIELRGDCRITDEDFSSLYDYKRTRRYLFGLLQILKETTVINDLDNRQKTMLIWHKYLRLVIPALLFLCYLSLGMATIKGILFVVPFIIATMIGILSILPLNLVLRFRFINLVRMNIFYFVAFIDILINNHEPTRTT